MKYVYNVALVMIIALLIGSVLYMHYGEPPKTVPRSNPTPPTNYNPPSTLQVPNSHPIIITASPADYDRFERIMPKTDLVKDIPSNGKIQMSFFNFNSGNREWERDYILTTGAVTQGTADDVDIKLILHSRNLPKLTENNICEIFPQAKKQGDFGSELLISKITFSWRYKSMMGYKSCLGF